jgi:hypothetical protein
VDAVAAVHRACGWSATVPRLGGGTGGLKPLTDADRAEIKRTLQGKDLLHTAEHPTITFRSTSITGTPQSFEIAGDLTIKGRTHPVTVHGKGNGDTLLRGWATVTQSTWGIKPYTPSWAPCAWPTTSAWNSS